MSLSDVARGDEKVLALLTSSRTNVEVAQALSVGEASVRRARRKLQDQPEFFTKSGDEPTTIREFPDKNPKDMPVFAEYEGPNGRAALHLPRQGYTEHDLLREAGFDPDCWRIKGHVNTRKWMRHDQEWLFYYKFDVEQGESVASKETHVEDLVKVIRKRSKGKASSVGVEGGTYVFVCSDWQIGKSEGGRNSECTVERFHDCLAQAVDNIKMLRKGGNQIDNLAIVSVGDLVEGCGDHYPMQSFSVDLDRRSQNRVVRELLTKAILTLSPMFDHTTIAVVGGNHGENRRDGKAYTTFADNDDVGCPEAVREAFDLAGWDHIEWHIPDEELSMCVDLNGVKVGLVHGHQFKGGVNAWKKAEDWWRSNVFGLESVNEAQILLSGHYHFYCNVNVTAGRTWMQAPTIDPGSLWFTHTTGITSIPGVLTFVADAKRPLGHDFVRVLIPANVEQATGV